MFGNTDSSQSAAAPAFIAKLWHMVSDSDSDDLICWTESGKSFLIKDQVKFCMELLPKYYKHNNMASFIRQLNKYGFHKVVSIDSWSLKNEKSDFEFVHPHFVKDSPTLLALIKRKMSSSREVEVKNDSMIVGKLLQDMQKLQTRQKVLESQLTSMKKENDALWREQSIMRHNLRKQRTIVNKLIQFLVTLIQQIRGLNLKKCLPLMLKDHSREKYVAIEDGSSFTPLICEVDPNTVLNDRPVNTNRRVIEISPILSPDNHVGAPLNIKEEMAFNVPSPSVEEDPLLLNDPLPSPISIAVPIQEVSPAILQTAHHSNFEPVASSSNMLTHQKITSAQKKSTNRKSLITNKKNKSNNKLINVGGIKRKPKSKRVSNNITSFNNTTSKLGKSISKDVSVNPVSLLSPDLRFIDEFDTPEFIGCSPSDIVLSNEDANENVGVDSNVDTSQLIVTSPNGTVIPSHLEINNGNSTTENNSLVLSESSSTKKDERTNNSDVSASDLDILKDILHNEGLSLDASTLMGLLNNEDPLSLNLPDSIRVENEDSTTPSGNELVTYAPNLMDMAEILDDEEDEEYTSLQDIMSPAELNTPKVDRMLSPEPNLFERSFNKRFKYN